MPQPGRRVMGFYLSAGAITLGQLIDYIAERA